MKVAFIVYNAPGRYSGGRIHALWLAYAFAANGYEVDYFTNCIPVFWKDMPSKYRNRIHFIISKIFMWHKPNKDYKHIVIVPHFASCKSEIVDRLLFYPFARRLKESCECLLWYLDFESPSWIFKTDPALRPMAYYRNSNRILKDCNIVLSTTKTGQEHAKEYYSKFNSDLKFLQLYLAINTDAAEGIDYTKESNSAMFFARFGQKHKGNDAIVNIVKCLPRRFQLDILGDRGAADSNLMTTLEKLCASKEIKLFFHKNISDRDKFKLLGNTRIVFFSSNFEGYGIPPLEAQYMGASVVCSDLPVLREVNPLATYVNFDDLSQLEDAITYLRLNPQIPQQLRMQVERIASPDTFYSSLGKILNVIK